MHITVAHVVCHDHDDVGAFGGRESWPGKTGCQKSDENEQAGVTGQLEFKLWFNNGGCATFLRVFFSALEELRAVPVAVPVAEPSSFTQAVAAGTFVDAAFIDPSDPTVVYTTQPVAAAEVPVAYPTNNIVATAVPVAAAVPAAAGQSEIPVATVAQPAEGQQQPVAAGTVVSTGFQ